MRPNPGPGTAWRQGQRNKPQPLQLVRPATGSGHRRWLPDAIALGFILLVTGVYLAPALLHGTSLGPYDLLSQYGTTAQPGVSVHNAVGSDEILELIPWQLLDWVQVHAGHLPLWNPYSLLGLPLAFNMQSSPFSLSVAVGYAFPLALAHDATVVARMLIAASGAYAFCRTLRLSVVAATLAAISYELSGGFSIWLGSNISDEMAWVGWVLAASVLVTRQTHRVRSLVALTAAMALALYAGEPQMSVLLLCVLLGMVMVTQLHRYRHDARIAARSTALDHLIAVLASIGLAAPLYLPALQLGGSSARALAPPVSGLPLYDLTHYLAATYNGSPVTGSQIIGPDNLYGSMLYVGPVVIVLALVGVLACWDRIEVRALSLIGACLLFALFFSPVVWLFSRIPDAKVFRLDLCTTLSDFTIVILAAFGANALLRRRAEPKVLRWLAIACGIVGLGLAVLAVRVTLNSSHLDEPSRLARAESLIWPLISLGACLALYLLLRARDRTGRGRRSGLGFIGIICVQAGLLISAGAGIWSSANGSFPQTAATRQLQQVVGNAVVGMGTCPILNGFSGLGLAPNTNLAYGVDELSVYDPIVPRAYYSAYAAATGQSGAITSPGVICPAISSVALAREFGVGYVLEPPGVKGPVGTQLAGVVANEGVYKVPDSGRATLVSLGAATSTEATTASVTTPSPSSVQVATNDGVASRLELRLTDVPGWSATVDGKPLPLAPWHQVMLQALLPPGHHVVSLRYWPRALTIGLWCALGSLLLLGAVSLVLLRARRPQPA